MTIEIWTPTPEQEKELTRDIIDERNREAIQEYEDYNEDEEE